MDPREALARLRAAAEDGRLEPLCRRHGIRLLGAFGSATDPAWPGPRDLDIAVEFERGANGDIIALMNDLMALTRFDRIDLLDLGRASANPVARTSALVGGVPLYESESGTYARAQIHAIMQRMDTAWLRRLELELLAS
ncbi:MAG: hypothetical protein GEU81_07485 [Nitriliruptorales bacterium]|nr:hypothetical protein [Nitriliruptorales bacterium]